VKTQAEPVRLDENKQANREVNFKNTLQTCYDTTLGRLTHSGNIFFASVTAPILHYLADALGFEMLHMIGWWLTRLYI